MVRLPPGPARTRRSASTAELTPATSMLSSPRPLPSPQSTPVLADCLQSISPGRSTPSHAKSTGLSSTGPLAQASPSLPAGEHPLRDHLDQAPDRLPCSAPSVLPPLLSRLQPRRPFSSSHLGDSPYTLFSLWSAPLCTNPLVQPTLSHLSGFILNVTAAGKLFITALISKTAFKSLFAKNRGSVFSAGG